jgi:A/G-specific adenine glycosylase
VLLQQTQVSRGLEYYHRFLTAFPTIHDLAVAPLEAVLKAWEGAGYYARARNLHKAAQAIARDGFPTSFTDLMVLPGVGRYTAGAVASIAFGEAVPVVDGNVRRVLARVLLEPNPTEDWLWREAQRILEPAHPGDWNQSVMELGATICTPKNPSCASCPVSRYCKALEAGAVFSTPAPKPRAAVKTIQAVALMAGWNGRYVLEQRPKRGLLGGLHGFPVEVSSSISRQENGHDEALLRLLERFKLEPNGVWLGCVTHTMTHRQFEIHVYAVQYDAPDLEHPLDVALSRLDQKILGLLKIGLLFQNSAP